MKLLLSLVLILFCVMLLPGQIQALDSEANQQETASSKKQNAAAAKLGADYSPAQRLQAYFSKISRQKITDSLDLETGSLGPWAHQGLQAQTRASRDYPFANQAFYLSLPLHMQGLRLSPYFVQAWSGHSPGLGHESQLEDGAADWPRGHAQGYQEIGLQDSWMLGANYALELFQPLSLQGNMLKADVQQEGQREQGLLLDLSLSYATNLGTPSLWARYSKTELEGTSEPGETLPRALRNLDFTPGLQHGKSLQGLFGPGLGGYSLVQALAEQESQGYLAAGSWQVGLGIRDISFLQGLEHSLDLTYGRGTYDQNSSQEHMQGLSKEDSFFEARLDQRYRLYENLAAIMELGYASLDLDPEIWGEDPQENAYLMSFGLNYEF